MDQWPRIRRLANGSIDYDFYRRNARAQRAAAIGDFFTLRKPDGPDGPGAALTFLARLRAARKT